MVGSSDQNHLIFSPSISYRTTHLPSPSNNNKVVRSTNNNNNNTTPVIIHNSRKSSVSSSQMYRSVQHSRTNQTLPPLDKTISPRARNGNTLPSSRSGSTKISRIELNSSKRSRSAVEDNPLDAKNLTISGGRAQQITQTVRVLRARSALLLPSPQLNLAPPVSQPLQIHPLILKSEDRKKRR